MESSSAIRSRLSPEALKHLKAASEIPEYRPFSANLAESEGLIQLARENLVIPMPSGSSVPGPFLSITELGRQVLRVE